MNTRDDILPPKIALQRMAMMMVKMMVELALMGTCIGAFLHALPCHLPTISPPSMGLDLARVAAWLQMMPSTQ